MGLRKLLVAGIAGLVLSTTYSTPTRHVGDPSQEQIARKILENTKENQVVMFGEIHQDYRKDNDFVIGLLPELQKQGFSYLALEIPIDVSNLPKDAGWIKVLADYTDGKIERSGIPPGDYFEIYKSGAGWIELIEKARELGMNIVRYDDIIKESDDVVKEPRINNARENNAFKNLQEQIFKNEPGAKVIVYCGAFHVSERSSMLSGKEIIWLGSYLDTYTSGKSFTVSFAQNKDVHIPFCDLDVVFED